MQGEDFFLITKRPITAIEATCHAIFLDFDNSSHRPVNYFATTPRNEAKLNQESIDRILSMLNDVFSSQKIEFVSTPPENDGYHTIFVNDNEFEPSPCGDDVVDISATEIILDAEQHLIDTISRRAEELLREKMNR